MPAHHSASELPTRASLIASLRQGDSQAWQVMADLYAPLDEPTDAAALSGLIQPE